MKLALIAVLGLLWLWWVQQVRDMRPGRPNEPGPNGRDMTPEEALAYLVVRYPCGCVLHWEGSPPYGMSCSMGCSPPHILPPYFLHAREVLRMDAAEKHRLAALTTKGTP